MEIIILSDIQDPFFTNYSSHVIYSSYLSFISTYKLFKTSTENIEYKTYKPVKYFFYSSTSTFKIM